MTATEFRDHLTRLGLSQMAFARVTGANPRTVRRWAAGGPIRQEIAMLVERLKPNDPVVRAHRDQHGRSTRQTEDFV